MAQDCLLIDGKVFQQYAKDLGLSVPSAAGVVYLWRVKSGSKSGMPSIEEARDFYKNQTFVTQDENAIKFYHEHVKDGVVSLQDFDVSIEEAFQELKRVFGEPNVFLVTKDSGQQEIQIAKMIEGAPLPEKSSTPTRPETEDSSAEEEEELPASTEDISKIVLTKEQQAAVDNAVSFIAQKMKTGKSPSGKKFLLIQGMAGTGKTTIVRSIVQGLEKQMIYPDFCVAALSRKAVHVLSEKMQDLGAKTETLYSLAGADPLSGPEKFAVDENKAKYSMYNLIFVDEASMVSDTIMKNIDNYVSEHPRTVVCFLGDEGQIRPIPKKGERSHKSTIFSRKDMQVENLTKRIRQGENSPILSYADKFWNISTRKTDSSIYSINGETSITKLGALIFETKPFVLSSIMDGFKKAVKEGNPTHVKVVTATNESVDSWNDDIRKVLFPESPKLICKGDLIIFNEPYKISPNDYNSPIIENSTEGQVTDVSEEFEDDGIKFRDVSINFSDGSSITVRRIDPKDYESLKLHKSQVEALHKRALSVPKSNRVLYRAAWSAYWQEFCKYADISYGYAVTDHKAQGSTYDIVAVDKDNILKAGIWGDIERAEMMYTALTRSRNVSVIVSSQGNDENISSYTELSDSIDSNRSLRKVVKTSQLPILGEFTNHSGGADGSDYLWGYYGGLKGVTSKHYYHGEKSEYNAPYGNVLLTEEELNEGKIPAYRASKQLDRKNPDKYMDKLARNFYQAKNASEVFAIGVLKDNQVDGGTGYAVQMAINMGKPVHVFDQNKEQWYQYDYGSKSFVETDVPVLSKDFAGIGVRAKELKEAGVEAIKQVYEKTVEKMKTAPIDFHRQAFRESQPTDDSMSSQVTRELATQDAGEKPQGNVVEKNAFSIEVSENKGVTKKTVTITPLVEKTSFEEKKAHIERLILSGELDLGTRIQVSGTDAKSIVDTVKTLYRMKGSFVYPSTTNTFLSEESLTESDVKALKDAKIPLINGNYMIPTFTVGFTEYELAQRQQLTNLLSQGTFSQPELREYSKRAVFKVSELISLLQEEPEAAKQLFGNNIAYRPYVYNEDGSEIDYTQMSRIDIINKIGLNTFFDLFIKESIFNPAKRRDLGKKYGLSHLKKIKVIFDNFEAFKQLSYDTLISMEEMTFDGKKAKVEYKPVVENEDGEVDMSLDADTEQELAEVFGSSVEHWQVGFRQVSAFNSLSQLIKNTVSRFYDLDANGVMQIDEVGMSKTVDTAEAISKILQWTQKATTLSEMVDMLSSHLSTDPWLRQLVGKGDTAYHVNENEDSDLKEGLLVDPEQQQFQSQFFTNFRKYFQSYYVTFLDDSGEVVTRSVNSPSFEVETLNNIKSLARTADNGMLKIWDAENNTLSKDFRRMQEIIGTPAQKQKGKPEVPASGMYVILNRLSNKEELTQDLKIRVANAVKEVYQILNIETPELEHLVRLFSDNPKNLAEFVKTVSFIINREILPASEAAKVKGGRFELFGRKGEKIAGKDAVNATSNYRTLIKLISPVMSSSTEAVSYEGGKLYYGYVTPSYLGILVDKLKGNTGKTFLGRPEDYNSFMQREYLKYEGWFYNSRGPKYGPEGHLNYWLSLLNGPEGDKHRETLEHVASLTFDGTAYVDKTSPVYYASLVSMYLYDSHKNYSYFRIPTLSNKPSEEYLKFARISDGYEKTIVSWLAEKTFYQELNRIKTVNDRKNISDDEKIDNFDKTGKMFHFLPFLNERMRGNDEFAMLLNKVVNERGLDRESNEGKRFQELLYAAIKQGIEDAFDQYILDAENDGFLTLREPGNAKSEVSKVFQIDKIVTKSSPSRRETLREYFYNDYFATINILQLTVGDIALYKNAEDLQKRLAQIHSPGMRGNIQAKDITFKKSVSDGKFRAIMLSDEEISSSVVTNIKAAFNSMLNNPIYHVGNDVNAALTPTGQSLERKFKDILKVFEAKKNKWTDGQAYSSPTSYRKKMHLYGKWSQRDEDAYQKVINRDFTEEDLDVIWQPIKPFVYSQISKNTGSDAMPLIKMGVQYKNSEYLLVIADALMKSQGIQSPLAAIFDVMEESQGEWVEDESGEKFIPNGRGIDTIGFHSCVKTGGTGVININGKSYDEIVAALRDAIYDPNGEDGYNQTYVDTIPFDDYTIQQEVPPHFRHEQQMGSQARIHTIADLPETSNGAPLYITISTEKDGKVTQEKVTVAEAKRRYMAAVAENIDLSFKALSEELGLSGRFGNNTKFRNIALSRILQQEILRDGRLGSDMLWAVGVNDKGEFNIPLSDPIHSGRLQQLLNSIIKNNINKQKIAGGPVVQVSAYGTSEELNIRFKNKDGKLLLSRKEFEQYIRKQKKRTGSFSTRFVDFEDYVQQVPKDITEEEFKELLDTWYESYVKDNQHSLAYFEAYAPIYDERLMEFADENGVIDIKAIDKMNPKLLEMVGYRIPTEAKYSMIPIKIIGFLPRNSGEGIMLPADITTLTGSDFDIDKLYIMRYAIRTSTVRDLGEFGRMRAIKKAERLLEEGTKMSSTEAWEEKERVVNLYKQKEEEVAPEDLEEWKELKRAYYKDYKGTTIFTTEVKDARERNNNTILSLTQAILTSPIVVDQIFSPGNFDAPKKIGYLIKAAEQEAQNGGDFSSIVDKLDNESIDSLKDLAYKKSSLLFANVQVKFHKQNTVAGKLIGVFAQANVSHGFIGLLNNPTIKVANSLDEGFRNFTLAGRRISGDVRIDPMYAFDGVTRVSQNLASLLAASVDAVKDPVLNLFNLNMTTVNIAVALIRLGYSIDTVGWLLTTPIVKELTERYESASLEGSTNIENIISQMEIEIANKHPEFVFDPEYNLSVDDLIKAHNQTENTDDVARMNYQILGTISRINDIAGIFRQITHVTRYNSIASAVGPFASNTAIAAIRDEKFINKKAISSNVKAILENPIIRAFRNNSYSLEKSLIGQNFVQGGPFAKEVYEKADAMLGNLSDQTAQKLSEFLMSYVVNIDNPIFDLSDEGEQYHRDMIYETTPDIVINAKTTYPDNKFLKAIRVERDKHGNRILTISTRGRDNTEIQDLKTGWDQLLTDETKRLGENAFDVDENFALRLVQYNFILGGFGFSGKTFMSLVPNSVKIALPRYLENLNSSYLYNSIHTVRLIEQFLLNNGIANVGVFTKEEFEQLIGAPLSETTKTMFTAEEGFTTGIVAIKENKTSKKKKFYKVSGHSLYTVHPLEKLGGQNQGFEINPQLDVEDMHSMYVEVTPSKSSEGNPETPEREQRTFTLPDYVKRINAINSTFGWNEILYTPTDNIIANLRYAQTVLDQVKESEETDDIRTMKAILKGLNLENLSIEQLKEIETRLNLCK